MNDKRVPNDPKPHFIIEDHLIFLDDLRESGETNMFGARPYLMDAFQDLTKMQAGDVVSYWMRTFAERHGLPT